MALNEKELDFGYAEGFLIEWLKGSPAQVKEHLDVLVEAIKFYKGKLADAETDLRNANDKYSALMLQSAQYLELLGQQKELIDQNLIENQREFHTKERELPQI